MFVHFSQSASVCWPEQGQMLSRLAVELKRGLFGNSMQTWQTISWNLGNSMNLNFFLLICKKSIDNAKIQCQNLACEMEHHYHPAPRALALDQPG
jgi:hypothetical protein